MMKTLLILGRPNVGKSSLFNRLARKRRAIVHDRPGVTRDLILAEATWHGQSFRLIDTAGLEESLTRKSNEGDDVRARELIADALDSADLVLLLLDASEGLTNADEEIAAWLRDFNRPVHVAWNKAEGRNRAENAENNEAYRLGFGAAFVLSATHNQGVDEMMARLVPTPEIGAETPPTQMEPRRLAILGRPNVGKSTLINRLLKSARQVTGDTAGLTRDAVELPWVAAHDDAPGWHLIDTAGLKSHGQYRDMLDRSTARATWNAINRADVVALMIEAHQPLTRGDLSIARDCALQGCAMMMLVNKTDLCDNPAETAQELSFAVTESLAQIRHLPFLCLSALHQTGLETIHTLAETQANRAARRVSTGALNRWLAKALARHPLPLVKGRRMRIKYITQSAISPPEFVLFTAHKTPIPTAYLRYLQNALVDDFGFEGIPIRIKGRRGENPYDNPESPPSRKPKHRAQRALLPANVRRKVSFINTGKKALSLKSRARTKRD